MPVSSFLRAEEDLIIGRLSGITRHGISELSVEQIEAWRSQIPVLREALCGNRAQAWHLLLEFPIPRRGKRIDAVVLAGSAVLVLEFKNGARHYQREGIAQVEDYCLDLRDFHLGSRQRAIVPILIATLAKEVSFPEGPPFDFVAPVGYSNAGGLGQAAERYGDDFVGGETERLGDATGHAQREALGGLLEHLLCDARRAALLRRWALLAGSRLAVLEDPAGIADLRASLRVE